MASPSRAGFVAPDARPRMRELGALAQLDDVSCRLTRLMRTRDPLEAVRVNDAEADDATVVEAAALERSPAASTLCSVGQCSRMCFGRASWAPYGHVEGDGAALLESLTR